MSELLLTPKRRATTRPLTIWTGTITATSNWKKGRFCAAVFLSTRPHRIFLKKFNIPHRIGAVARSEGAVTEASYLAIAGLGIPVGEVLIPIRYMHSPYQLGAFDDLYQTKKLLTCFTRALNSKTIFCYN